jgi:ferredoxin-nitrite reductase
MDNIRNVMGCSLSGITPHELFDVSPVVREFNELFVGNREFTNLPRKFNVTLTSCIDNCVHLETQDIAMGPAVKQVGDELVAGFNVLVGGKQGSGGFVAARPLDVFVRPEEAAKLAGQIVLLFRDHGSRETRSRARLCFLVDDWGIDRFREAVEERMGHALEQAGRDARSGYHTDHMGFAPQREPGLYTVGLSAPVGKLTSAQLFAAADLADRYGHGELRLTPSQNLILPGVTDRDLPRLLNEPLLEQLRPDALPAVRGTVSCTGLGTCDMALAETKDTSLAAARRVDANVPLDRPISINWSGCPASCGNHLVSDIGVQGDKARVNGEVIEVYNIFAGGKLGIHARGAKPILTGVPATQVGEVIERLAQAHADGRDLIEAGRAIAREAGHTDEETALIPVG